MMFAATFAFLSLFAALEGDGDKRSTTIELSIARPTRAADGRG